MVNRAFLLYSLRLSLFVEHLLDTSVLPLPELSCLTLSYLCGIFGDGYLELSLGGSCLFACELAHCYGRRRMPRWQDLQKKLERPDFQTVLVMIFGFIEFSLHKLLGKYIKMTKLATLGQIRLHTNNAASFNDCEYASSTMLNSTQ